MTECLICKSSTRTIAKFDGNFKPIDIPETIHFCWPIRYCPRCGVIRINANYTIFEQYHYMFTTYRNPDLEEKWRIRKKDCFQWLIQCIEKLNITNKSIIDFGYSYGHMLQLMKERGWKVCGVEIDNRLLKILQHRFTNSAMITDFKLIPELSPTSTVKIFST